jgi:hypothetical protein
MAFIKCPECGQTALSIASVCPKCGYLLMQHTPPHGSTDALHRCPRCDKYVDRHAPRCAYCAFPIALWRKARWGMLAVVGLVIVLAAIWGFGTLKPTSPVQPIAQTPAPVVPTPMPSEPEDTTPVVAAPIVVDTLTPRAGPSDSTPQPAPIDTIATVDRWVVTWANLREGPGLDQPVIRILLPGERVRVAPASRGFAAVYGTEGFDGYVAVSLLSERELPRDSIARVQPR